MKTKVLISLFCLLSSLMVVNGQTVYMEDFEGQGTGQTFTNNGITFSLVSKIQLYAPQTGVSTSYGLGVHSSGSGTSDHFVDNNCINCHVANTSYLTTSGTWGFKMKSLYFYASSYSDGNTPTNDGTITFRGKLNGVVQFTVTKSSGWPTNFNTYNGFSFFDFGSCNSWANSYTATDVTTYTIDTLCIDMGSAFLYEAFDVFRWYKAPPTLSNSNAASTIGGTSAICGGSVTNQGSAAVTERGVVWSTSANPTTSSGTKVTMGTGGGSFSGTVSGLSPSTTYNYRTYAINSIGTSYGSNVSFTTNAALSATQSSTNINCFGASTGTATVVAAGGTLSYTYAWSPSGGTAATASNLAAGNYTCTITDQASVQVTKTFTLTQPAAALSATTSQTNVTCTGGSDGSMTVTASNGTPGYTYSWSPSGGTAATASSRSAGNYTCTITDSKSCQLTKTFTLGTSNTLPAVSGHPSAATICAGANTSFSVTATGSGITYQWQVNTGSGYGNVSNGGVYTTATTATLNITGATAGMNGYQYRCVVSGTCTPAATSNGATLTVNSAPSVGTHPSATSVCSGSNTSITVSATGAGLSYQWQVNTGSGYGNITNGGVYSTATTATLNITGATTGMNGYAYRCVISGTCSPSATSNGATLTVNSAPSVGTHPSSATICAGSNSSFTVAATGAGLTYQWQVNTGSGYGNVSNGGVYSNATTATLNITAATAGMTGYQYRCVVSGTCSPSATSNGATLTVNTLPAVSAHPSNASPCAGSNTSFSVTASGTGITYQWQVNTGSGYSNISNTGVYTNATTATLNITGATAGMNGYLYQCVVTGTCSPAATSNAATLTVNSAPSVSTHPFGTSTCPGSNASFTVSATGAGLTYQWQESTGGSYTNISNGGVYSTATTATLNITGATAGMTGYNYKCVVSGTCSPSATSNPATLTMNTAPSVSGHPSDATTCAGSNTSFTATASGTSLTYQWQVNTGSGYSNVTNGSVYTNATTATLSITGATAGMSGYLYRCVVSGTCSPSATSNAATLTVNTLPAISADPSDATICAGANTSFSVTASGTGLTYQWQVSTGGSYSNLSNAGVYSTTTTATLNITGATAGMTGYTYKCVVSGTCSPSATSAAATLTVNSSPSISAHPSNTPVCAGSNTSISVTATGAGLTYQWQESTGGSYSNISNTGVYSTATTATLNITGATAGMSGYTYKCVVSGTCTPAMTSNAATLTVNTAPSFTAHPGAAAICLNTNASFTATATGTGVTYQWQEDQGGGFANVTNTGVYSGATSQTLMITGAPTSMNGYVYRCVASGTCTPAATSNSATLTVYDASTWTGATSSSWSTGSNWCGGSPPATSANVTISGSTNMLQITTGTFTFNNLSINNGSNLTITGGTLSIEGSVSGSGTITATGGNIAFTGSSAQTIPAGLFTSNEINSLEINNDAGVALSGTLKVKNVLTLTDGTFATNGFLTLGSDASGTARVPEIPSGADITGNVNGQRYVPAVNRQYRLFSPFVANFDFSQIIDDMFVSGPGGSANGFDNSSLNNSSIHTYKEDNSGSARGWKGLTNISNTLQAGKGALVFVRGDRSLGSPGWYTTPFPAQNVVNVDWSGTINKGTISPTITYTSTGDAGADGWNLVGNPYPSPISWSAITKSNLGSFYYTFDPATSAYVANNGSNFIASGQAFFVQATGTSPTITFEETSKTASSPTNYFKSSIPMIQGKMTMDSLHSDLLWIEYKTGANTDYAASEDAFKFSNPEVNFGVLVNHDSVRLQYSTTPLLSTATDTFRLFVDAAAGTYSFSFSQLSSLPSSHQVYLQDRFTSALQDLRSTPDYSFSISTNPNSFGNDRFRLIVVNPSLLPVTWMGVSAHREGRADVRVNWQTAQERNNSHFVIERSLKPEAGFEEVGAVQSLASGSVSSYTFTDRNAFGAKPDVLYYRIRQVDKDGAFTVSDVVTVTMAGKQDVSVAVYPNPASDVLHVRVPSGMEALSGWEMTDAAGRTVRESNCDIPETIDIHELNAGVYLLRIKGGEGRNIAPVKFTKE